MIHRIRVPRSLLLAAAAFCFSAASLSATSSAAEGGGGGIGWYSGYCNGGTCCGVSGAGFTGCRDSCGQGPVAQGTYFMYSSLSCTGTTDC